MRPLYLALVVAVFALSCGAAFADDASPEKPNLVIHLSADKEEYTKGEPIVLTLTVENTGDASSDFCLVKWGLVTQPEVKWVAGLGGEWKGLTLFAGAYYGEKVNLLRYCEMLPGEYVVKAVFMRFRDTGCFGDNSDDTESNEIRIVVKAKPGEPPKPGEQTEAERIKQLIADLGSNDWETRENATQELIKIGQSALDALVAVTKESADPEVVWRAQGILKELGYVTDEAVAQKVQGILDGIKQNDWMVKETLGLEIVRLGPRVIGTLKSYLDNSDYRIRQVVVELLGKIPDKQIVQILIDTLDDGDKYVRASAAKELRRISGQTFTSDEKDKWQAWWNENREGFHLPEVKLPEPPKPEPPGPEPGPLPPEPMPLPAEPQEI